MNGRPVKIKPDERDHAIIALYAAGKSFTEIGRSFTPPIADATVRKRFWHCQAMRWVSIDGSIYTDEQRRKLLAFERMLQKGTENDVRKDD